MGAGREAGALTQHANLPDQTAAARPPRIRRRSLFTPVSSATVLPAVPRTEPTLA
jgi:hypothetical protein